MPVIDLHKLTFKELFRELSVAIREFSSTINRIIERHEQEANTQHVKEIMDHIRSRVSTDKREEGENAEIARLLNQLLIDKEILSLVKIEGDDWLEFLEAIEKRLEVDKGLVGKDELKAYEDIKELSSEIKMIVRSQKKGK